MVGVYKKREKIKYKNQLFQIIERKDKKLGFLKIVVDGEKTEYEGIRIAERENNANRSNIRYAIIHNGICKGYKWRYKDEKYNNVKPKIKLDICLPPIVK